MTKRYKPTAYKHPPKLVPDNKITIVDPKDRLVLKAHEEFLEIIASVPAPTQEEIKKLLAIQGFVLNQFGMNLLVNNKLKHSTIAIKALTAARTALSEAARIEQYEEKKKERTQETEEK